MTMPYAPADFDELVRKVDDGEYRLAHLQVHDDMYLALASLTKLFVREMITPEHVFAVVHLVADRHRGLKRSE